MSRRDPDQEKVEKEIRLALEVALAEYNTALTEFEEIIAAPPRHPPSPDEIFRFEESAVARRLAFKNYQEAMKRFSDLTLGRDGS